MSTLPRLLVVLVAGLAPATGHAQNPYVGVPVGGIQFEGNADVVLAREDLYLSPDEVRVDYVFSSSTEQPQAVTIAFPLPRVFVPLESSPWNDLDLDGVTGDIRNYLDLGIAVNGRPIIPILHEYAWDEDRQVTAQLRAAGIPLMPTDKAWIEAGKRLAPETIAMLDAAGVVQDRGTYVDPSWQYQAVYTWSQTFEQGTTTVSIRYRPMIGWPTDYSYLAFIDGERAQAACVDEALRQKLADANTGFSVALVDYITGTTPHGSQPIGQFNLTVAAGNDRAILSAVCPAVTTMDEDGTRHWSTSNHVPTQDIHVTFYYLAE